MRLKSWHRENTSSIFGSKGAYSQHSDSHSGKYDWNWEYQCAAANGGCFRTGTTSRLQSTRLVAAVAEVGRRREPGSLPRMNVAGFISNLFGENNPKRMPKHLFFGAQRLDYKTAQRADISKQHYTVCPRHWYVDATFICSDCGREFVFTASEQRFWYE